MTVAITVDGAEGAEVVLVTKPEALVRPCAIQAQVQVPIKRQS